MSDISFIERMALEKLLGMSSGYVLDFSSRSFQEFVAESVGLNIFDHQYHRATGSKANRLRAFWNLEPNHVVGRLLTDLLAYACLNDDKQEATSNFLLNECVAIANRLLRGTTMPSTQPLLFIAYARPDVHAVRAVVALMSDAGLRTWFDKEDLKGGQEWEFEIRQRISEASLVLVCLSTNAVDRKGFFHREMRYAVDEALNLPKGKVYVMPVRLNDCAIPDDLRQWHALDLFARDAPGKLLNSIGDALDCGARARREACDSFVRAMREYNVG